MQNREKIILVAFAPVTIYFAIGTLFYLMCSKLECLTEKFGIYSGWPGIDCYRRRRFHKSHFILHVLLPICGPLVLLLTSIRLGYASFAAFMTFCGNSMVRIWELTSGAADQDEDAEESGLRTGKPVTDVYTRDPGDFVTLAPMDSGRPAKDEVRHSRPELLARQA